VTVEIVNAPPRPAVPVAVAPRLWPAVLRRCVLAPLVVLLPLVALTPAADHRFNVYANGGRYLTRPWLLPRTAIESVPTYLELGNFRPLGRLVEWSLDVVAFALTALLAVPANISLRIVSFAAAMLLTLAAVVLAESVTARGRLFARPSVLVALLPFAVAAGFVAAGRTSTTVLFGGLYFTSAALVLAVAAWACRSRRPGVLVFLAGAGLAAFNEIAYLALPLATAAVLLRGRLVRGPGLRFVALLWAGFLPVFVPVRLLIQQKCAAGGCYAGSDISLAGAPAAVPNRLVSWLPPLMWQRATEGVPANPVGLLSVLALVALALLAWRAVRQLPRLAMLDRRQALALAGVAAVAVLLAATLASLNAGVQQIAAQGHWGQGWRDSAVTSAAGGILLLCPVAAGRRVLVVPALAVLVVAGAFSVAANEDFRAGSGGGRYPYLHDRIAQEVAGFDRTPAGNARRCALRDAFRKNSHLGVHAPELERFDVSLDRATRQLAGQPFCREAAR
jgi:hypothetical protein